MRLLLFAERFASGTVASWLMKQWHAHKAVMHAAIVATQGKSHESSFLFTRWCLPANPVTKRKTLFVIGAASVILEHFYVWVCQVSHLRKLELCHLFTHFWLADSHAKCQKKKEKKRSQPYFVHCAILTHDGMILEICSASRNPHTGHQVKILRWHITCSGP